MKLCKENGVLQVFTKKKNGKIYNYNGFQCINLKDKTYMDGIKQIISHYIGLEHFINKENDEEQERSSELPKNAEIYLAEIMFDFNFEEAQDSFEAYSVYYRNIAESLNSLNPKIHVVPELLKYSLFKTNEYKLPEAIRKFYFGE